MENLTTRQQNRTAVITGASSGIGRAAALELAAAGFRLVVCSRNLDKLNALQSEIDSSRGEAHVIRIDVADSIAVASLVEFASQKLGRVDVLFNNAGSGKVISLEETTDEIWQETIGSTLLGTFHCCREFLPLLRKSSSALIINNASAAAHFGYANFAAYSAAKGGIASFSRSLREELRADNIRVTALAVGATDSAFWNGQAGEWDRSRMMSCESIARLIRFVAEFPDCAQLEEITVMPRTGAL